MIRHGFAAQWRPLAHDPRCSRRIRRTSSIASGFDWTEWPDRTIFSDATPSRCALRYDTTPSLPSSGGPSPWTAMIEWAVTPGATGSDASVRIAGLDGLMLSTLLGRPRPSDRRIRGSSL